MSKNPEDGKRVTKGAVKELARKHVAHGMLEPLIWDIDQLPTEDMKSREQIERAIENLEKSFKEMKTENYPWGSYAERMQQINLLRWALNQPQEEKGYPGSTWTDEELLGEEKVFGK